MQIDKNIEYPNIFKRIYSVWYRFVRVYTRHLISNGLPPFFEPLIFLMGIGIGLGQHIKEMNGVPYLTFLASATMSSPAMFTSSFECTFGTFIRMEYDKVYQGMLASSISIKDLFLGELLFAGTKGFFFSGAVLFIISIFGLVEYPTSLLAPFIGFFTGIMFGSIGLFITSFVRTLNQFNFYFTGFLTPLFFFSGMIFPISDLPKNIQWIAEVLPLTHSVRLIRGFCLDRLEISFIYDFIYMIIFSLIFTLLAIHRLRKRIIK